MSRPMLPASRPIVPSRRYGTASRASTVRATPPRPGRSLKLTLISIGSSLSARARKSRPSGNSASAARESSRNSVPFNVPRRTPNALGLVTRVQMRTPAPFNPRTRISAWRPGTCSKRGGCTSALRLPSALAQACSDNIRNPRPISRALTRRTAARSSPPSARLQLRLCLVHSEIGEAIRFLVELAPHVLERDLADRADERARLQEQRLQPFVLHLVLAAHLLDEQLRVGADVHLAMALRGGPAQGGEQAVVLGDVVGRDAEAPIQFVDHRAVGILDRHAVPRGARVPARPSVDVSRDQVVCEAGVGTK